MLCFLAPGWRDLKITIDLTPLCLFFLSVIYYLGYQREQLIGRSWYSLIHPEDAVRAAETHRTLSELYCSQDQVLFPHKLGES